MLYLLPFIVSSETCPAFICSSSTSPFGCISTSNTTISLSTCTSPYLTFCPYTDFSSDSTCISLPPSPFNTSWPGDFCYSNSTCISQYCSSSTCQGLLASSFCNDTGQCDVYNRCESGNCKVQLYIGFNNGQFTLNCTLDSDCVNQGACENGNCFKYFSRGEGEYVEDCIDGINWICESGMCYDNLCISPLASSLGELPVKCQNDTDCQSDYYLDGPQPFSIYSKCQCGRNSNGDSFCTLFPGDPVQKSYLNLLNEWINSDGITKCHSYSRFKLECIKANWEKSKYLEFAYYYYYSTMFPLISNNPDCVQDLITYQYYQAKSDFKNSKALWTALSALAFYIT